MLTEDGIPGRISIPVFTLREPEHFRIMIIFLKKCLLTTKNGTADMLSEMEQESCIRASISLIFLQTGLSLNSFHCSLYGSQFFIVFLDYAELSGSILFSLFSVLSAFIS